MNPAVESSIRAIIEQVLTEKNFITRTEANAQIAQAVASELGIGATDTSVLLEAQTRTVSPYFPASVTPSASAPISPSATPAPTASLAPPARKKPGRKSTQTPEERKAKRAEYQRNYRSKHKTGGLEAAETTAAATPVIAPVKTAIQPRKENGTPLPPPIAHVASVDLGDV